MELLIKWYFYALNPIMTKSPKFAVIGGGSWATAIAKMLCTNLDEIAWYMRNEEAIKHLKAHHHNPNYLS